MAGSFYIQKNKSILIGNIEWKVLDLGNSNKLLKQELHLTNQPKDTRSLPTNQLCRQTNNGDSNSAHSSIGANELTLLKDRLNPLKFDMVKLRLQSIESNLPTSARADPTAHQHSQIRPNCQHPMPLNNQPYHTPSATPYPIQIVPPQFIPGQHPLGSIFSPK